MIADNLKWESDPQVKELVHNENILYSGLVYKRNGFGFKQERNLVVTDQSIYNFKGKELKREFNIKKVKGITLSKKTDEFVIHGNEEEYDYHIISPQKDKLIEAIESAYEDLTDSTLKFCITEAKIADFVVSKKQRTNDPSFSKMPESTLYDIEDYIEKGGNPNITCLVGTSLKSFFQKKNSYKEESLSNFQVTKMIGRGKTSEVYCARYTDGNYYALKVIDKLYIIKNELFTELELEKNILTSFDSPFLAKLHFWFETETKIVFVMPLYRGGDLYQMVIRKQYYTEEMYLSFYAIQIAHMLQLLHDKNIIYRDLKLENLLIGDNGYLILTDFGSCRVMKDKTELSSSFCGTTEYISPEMIEGRGVNESTDWWSYGVVLFELLFEKPPFYHECFEYCLQIIQEADLKFPKEKNISDYMKNFIAGVK
ncbi:MAG: protein kinase [archaeon]|nr:protein kinase [archaeon]